MEVLFEQGCKLFNAGQYFEAHEVWEELWNEAEGERHAFLQGLIQVAAALHHATHRNWTGTRKLFASALDYLERGKRKSEPVDIVKLKDLILDFELALQKILSGEETVPPFFPIPLRISP